MTTVVAIRTNKWGVNEQRVYDQLSSVLGADLKVVFHNRPSDFTPPMDCVDINDKVISNMGLRVISDWGWRCGDYAYFALRQAYPNYDHYMLVEPDVYFAGDRAAFFDHLQGLTQDIVGLNIEKFDPKHRFARRVDDVTAMRAIFAMTRFSGRALDIAFKERQIYSQKKIPEFVYSNDEAFMFSYLMSDTSLTVADLGEVASDWFHDAQFDVGPDLLIEHVDQDFSGKNKVIHPVVDREFFKKALAKRMVGRTGVLNNASRGLNAMSSDDLDDIANIARDQLREHLRGFETRETKGK